jgi:hypothetical protein
MIKLIQLGCTARIWMFRLLSISHIGTLVFLGWQVALINAINEALSQRRIKRSPPLLLCSACRGPGGFRGVRRQH